MSTRTTDLSPRPRGVGLVFFAVVTVVFLALIQLIVVGLTAGLDESFGAAGTTEYLARNIVIPFGIGIMVLLVALALHREWNPVFVDDRPLPRLAIGVPLTMVVIVVVVVNYQGLAAKGLEFTLMLLVATFLTGFAEELLFRGIGVRALRDKGCAEFTVGWLSSVIFGLVHLINIPLRGVADTLLQVPIATALGFLFYLTMRATGSVVWAMLLHGLWNFSVHTTQIPGLTTSMDIFSTIAFATLLAVIAVVAILRRRKATSMNAPVGQTVG